jgi:hypothetical protein
VGNRFGNRRVAARASGEKGCRDQSQTSGTRGRRESTTAQSEETRDTVTNRERAALDSIVEERRRIEVTIFEVGVESTGVVGSSSSAGEKGANFVASFAGRRALQGLGAERAAPALRSRGPRATAGVGRET